MTVDVADSLDKCGTCAVEIIVVEEGLSLSYVGAAVSVSRCWEEQPKNNPHTVRLMIISKVIENDLVILVLSLI
jgi:hypothetical protein